MFQQHQKSSFPQAQWRSKFYFRRFWEQIVAIDWCIIDSIITIFFLENGASKTLFPTNPVTREKLLERCFDNKLLNALKLENLENGKLCSFCKPSAWWERTQRPLLTKVSFLKLEKLENANFAHFVSHPLDGNVLKDLFWQNWRLLKALKLEKLKNANFAHFVSRPLGENVLKDLF